LKYLPNMPTCHVGIAVGAHGPNNTLVLGDVSGPAALAESISCLDRGHADYMICGGSGTRVNTTRLNYSSDLPFAAAAESVDESSRPHDPHSQGVVPGEAAVSLLIESSASAAQRGASRLARVESCVSRFVSTDPIEQRRRSADRQPEWARSPDLAIAAAAKAAISSAGLQADQIGLIVSHGMGDPAMDTAERTALSVDFAKTPRCAPIANVGHTGCVSGLVELATAALSLAHNVIPPHPHQHIAPDSGLSLQARSLDRDHVLCLSYTSEGSAMATVLGR
ncbi:MAG: beta-ketoacyl synthase N-terminal-like domain-containing protein, partial [Planctomycetota bacterium]